VAGHAGWLDNLANRFPPGEQGRLSSVKLFGIMALFVRSRSYARPWLRSTIETKV
jgi:hypothetical protein